MSARGRISNAQRIKLVESGVVSMREAAKLIGVSPRTVRRYVHSGALSYARIGNRIVIPRAAAIEFVAAQTSIGSVA